MPREINMPKLSDTMEEGTINVWRKSEGDAIERGDVLVEIETDKADMEFEAYMAGTLAKVLVPAGETVAVGVPIAVVKLPRDSDEELASFLEERGRGDAKAPAKPATSKASDASDEEGSEDAGAEERPGAAARKPSRSAGKRAVPRGEDETDDDAGSAARRGRPSERALPQPTGITPTSKIPVFLPDPDRARATPAARVLAREHDQDKQGGAYEFPREFRKLRGPLVRFLVDLCRPSQLQAGPILRGFYFSGVRPVVVEEQVGGRRPAARSSSGEAATGIFELGASEGRVAPPEVRRRRVPQWVFLGKLFHDVVLGDEGARGAGAASVQARVLRRALMGLAAGMLLIWAAGMTISRMTTRTTT